VRQGQLPRRLAQKTDPLSGTGAILPPMGNCCVLLEV
jgi:hypothetical protein